jgi:hypothetical protein
MLSQKAFRTMELFGLHQILLAPERQTKSMLTKITGSMMFREANKFSPSQEI